MQVRGALRGSGVRRAGRWAATALAFGAGSAGCGLLLGLDEFVDAPPGSSAGGAGGGGDCADGARDCVGDAPRECADGAWVAQAPCDGAAPVCAAGQCVPCMEDERSCADSTPQRCEGGAWIAEAPCSGSTPGCREGACVPASCASGDPGAGPSCGPKGDQDCCASALVPGGTFNRSNDPAYPATVSAFQMDIYEVTVGRFRAFVEAGKGTQGDPPQWGDGAHPAIPGSGWKPAWTAELTPDSAALKAALKCPSAWAWSDTAGPHERRPINCVTWYEAFAFCSWDGGRLPTEAEWNYAAAGGEEQREYPWGGALDGTRASYGCMGDGSPACSLEDLLPVGSKSPSGDGRWGHAEMAGNAGELVLDYLDAAYPTPCLDCARITGNVEVRAYRGGHAGSNDYFISTSAQSAADTDARSSQVGVRCARVHE